MDFNEVKSHQATGCPSSPQPTLLQKSKTLIFRKSSHASPYRGSKFDAESEAKVAFSPIDNDHKRMLQQRGLTMAHRRVSNAFEFSGAATKAAVMRQVPQSHERHHMGSPLYPRASNKTVSIASGIKMERFNSIMSTMPDPP